MKKFLIKSKFKYLSVILSLLLAVAILFSTGASFNSYADAAEKEEKKLCAATIDDSFAEDKVIVIMDDGADNFKTYSVKDFPEAEISAVEDLTQSIKDMLRRQSAGSEEENRLFNRKSFKTILRLTLKYAGKQNVLNAVHTFEKCADIFCAEPDYLIQTESPLIEACMANPCGLNTINDIGGRAVTNWGLSSIRAYDAWKITKGSSSVKVGVIDSGIDKFHSDLQNRVSSTLGWSYIDTNVQTSQNSAYTDNFFGHGTHVAGIIGGDSVGVNKEIELISLQIKTDEKFGSNLVTAISYAIAHRIPVLNMSMLIYDYKDKFGEEKYVTDLQAFEWILYNYNGLLVVAAGNKSNRLESFNYRFPTSSDKHNMLVVGALNSAGSRWKDNSISSLGSNYGDGVDIYAPGAEIASTYPIKKCFEDCGKLTDEGRQANGHIGSKENLGYHYMSGTSMAAPFVTGVAALLLSINSGLNGKELKELILNYADEISMSYDGATHTVKKLNAYDSVLALRGTTFKTENVTTDSLKITGVEGEMPERLIIPEKIIGKKVVSIAQNAFLRCENIKSLKFSNISTLRTIGASAFGECKNLTEVVFPDSVTKIDCAAFIDCKNLKSIIFSDDSELNVIEVAAFGGCSSLTQIELPKNLSTLGVSAFNSCTNLNKVVFKNTYRAADIGSSCFDNTASSLKLYVSYNLLSTYISSVSGYADKFVCL